MATEPAPSTGPGSVCLSGPLMDDRTAGWLRRRLRNASLLLHDEGAPSSLLAETPDSCETRTVAGEVGEALRRGAGGGGRVVRLYGGSALYSAVAAAEVLVLADAGVPFEVVADHLPPAGHPALVRAEALSGAGGLLVFGSDCGDLPRLRRWLAGSPGPEDLAAALLRERAAPRPAHPIGLRSEFESRLRAEEAAISGVFLAGRFAAVSAAARWSTGLDLLGARVVVTRAAEQAQGLADQVRERGGEPILLPTIEIAPPRDPGGLDRAIEDLDRYNWLVFTSRNGVRFFFDRLLALGRDARATAHMRLACVGRATAEALEAMGLHPDISPEEFRAEPLAELLRPEAAGGRFLLPRAEEAREVLPEELRAAGAEVSDVAAYSNRAPEGTRAAWESIRRERFDAVTFTSPSTVRHLSEAIGTADLGPEFAGRAVACIGPVTASTARRFGLDPLPLPTEYTVEALADLLARCL